MISQVRESFGVRQVIASLLALGFLAAASLVVFVKQVGFDVSAAFGIAVVLAVVWPTIRAMSGSPYRDGATRKLARSVVGLLVLLGPVILVILAYAPLFLRAPHVASAQGLPAVAGILLLMATACALVGGRRAIQNDGRGAAPRTPTGPGLR